MPTWTVAPCSLRLPAATQSLLLMKALPLRPPAGKLCPEHVRQGVWSHFTSPHLTWDSVLGLWVHKPAQDITGIRGF